VGIFGQVVTLRSGKVIRQGRLVHDGQVSGPGTDQVLQPITQLQHDADAEFRQRQGPPVLVDERGPEQVASAIPPARHEDGECPAKIGHTTHFRSGSTSRPAPSRAAAPSVVPGRASSPGRSDTAPAPPEWTVTKPRRTP